VLGKLPAQLGGAGAKAVEEHLFDSTKKHAENLMTPNTKTSESEISFENALQVGCQTECDKKVTRNQKRGGPERKNRKWKWKTSTPGRFLD